MVVSKIDLSVSFTNKNGDTLSVAKNYEVMNEGLKLDFTSTPEEALYGGGFRAIDLDKRGTVLENYNQAHGGYQFGQADLNIAIPFLISNRGYALYIDNYARSRFDVEKTKSDRVTFNTTSGTMRFYFIGGNSLGNVLSNYTYLTGHQPHTEIFIHSSSSVAFTITLPLSGEYFTALDNKLIATCCNRSLSPLNGEGIIPSFIMHDQA